MPLKPNDISFTLDLVIDRTGTETKLLDIKVWNVYFLDHQHGYESGGLRPIAKELQKTLRIFDKDTIEFTDDDEVNPTRKVYEFNTNHVTVKQFVDAVVDFEKIVRPKTVNEYSGLHFFNHVFYEGIHLQDNGAYWINWGS